MKIPPLGAELFHADGQTDGQTDMTKLIMAFRKFAKTPKNSLMTVEFSGKFYIANRYGKRKQFES
jgi:hypothetical protein